MTDGRPATSGQDETISEAPEAQAGARQARGCHPSASASHVKREANASPEDWSSMMAGMSGCAEAFMRGGADASSDCCGPAFGRGEVSRTAWPAEAAGSECAPSGAGGSAEPQSDEHEGAI